MVKVGEVGFSYEPGAVRGHHESGEELGRREVDALRLFETRVGRARIHDEAKLI